MADISENAPARLPDRLSVENALAALAPGADEAALAAALTKRFPGFSFSATSIDDVYWRDVPSVVASDGSRVAELRPWMTEALAKHDGDVKALWTTLRDSDLQISEWHGNGAFALRQQGRALPTMYRFRLAARSNGAPGRSWIRHRRPGASMICLVPHGSSMGR